MVKWPKTTFNPNHVIWRMTIEDFSTKNISWFTFDSHSSLNNHELGNENSHFMQFPHCSFHSSQGTFASICTFNSTWEIVKYLTTWDLCIWYVSDFCAINGHNGPSAESGEPCIFPWSYSADPDPKPLYTGCASPTAEGGPWCPTEVDNDGVYISGSGKWGRCDFRLPACNREGEAGGYLRNEELSCLWLGPYWRTLRK